MTLYDKGSLDVRQKVIFYKEWHVYFLIIYSSIGLLTDMRRGWLTFFGKVLKDAPSSKKSFFMTRGGGGWVGQKVIFHNEVIFYKELHVYFLIISRAIVSLRGYSSIGLLTNMRRG